MSSSNGNQSALSLIGRILLAVTFIMSGLGKLGAPSATQGYIAAMSMPAPLLAYLGAVIVEVGGGAMLLVGYRTKLVAIVLALFCVVTALIFHRNFADQTQMVMFLKNVSIAGGFLLLVAHGAGPLSLDRRSAKKP